MNRMNAIVAISAGCLLAALLVPSADAVAVTKDEYCSDLSALEGHITDGSLALNATNNLVLIRTETSCGCSDQSLVDNSFSVDCAVVEHYPGGSTFETFERLVFGLRGDIGEFALRETSWGWVGSSVTLWDRNNETLDVDVVREVFRWDDGVLEGCVANACSSCGVCDDGTSIAANCGDDFDYAEECARMDPGAFANTFDFGTTTITGEAVADDSPLGGGLFVANDRDVETFCHGFANLEAHMNKSFGESVGKTYTSSFECACDGNEVEGTSFMVDCILEYVDGFLVYMHSEHMLFVLNDDVYELKETSWKGAHDNIAVQEVFNFENDVITSCEANGCTSCTVCDDQSIAVSCTNTDDGVIYYSHDCDDMYTGSFANSFDFGVITKTSIDGDVGRDDSDNEATGGGVGVDVDTSDGAPADEGRKGTAPDSESMIAVASALVTVLPVFLAVCFANA